ncbi:phosphatase PAP2 family protein [Salicibibacter kimchii]|uniref:phosphatase PAP2 family protein n=1 Tax=Salicibibacter kimchii TaxID=2099786 RepID=UPI00135AA572|nr:phosphatase PAP2 family protein [Salicibibacter kimchii]
MWRSIPILLLISISSTVMFTLIAISANQYTASFIDTEISNWFSVVENVFPQVMSWISFFGSGEVLMILTALLMLWLSLKKKAYAQTLFVAVVMGGGVLLNLGLKFLFQRGRPEDSSYFEVFGYTFEWVSYSFPSGHAMRAFLFWALIIHLIWLYVRHTRTKIIFSLLFVLLILFIGSSRVLLDAHFPTDILAAFAISLAWLTLCLAGFRIYYEKRLRKEQRENLKMRENLCGRS